MTDRVDFDPNLFGPDSACFGCAPHHPHGFHLTFAREGDEMVTAFTPSTEHQGPPGIMHGGLVMTLADELAAWTLVGLRDRMGFTVSCDSRFKGPVRIGAPVEGRSSITSASSRVIRVHAKLTQNAVEVFHADFAFALLDASGVERLLGQPLPDAWRRFAR